MQRGAGLRISHLVLVVKNGQHEVMSETIRRGGASAA